MEVLSGEVVDLGYGDGYGYGDGHGHGDGYGNGHGDTDF